MIDRSEREPSRHRPKGCELAFGLWLLAAASVGACTGEADPGDPQAVAVCGAVLGDPANCGACGVACLADQVCDLGQCKAKAQTCPAGLTACAGRCVDAMTLAAHCGGCDRACSATEVCSAGACGCAPGSTSCGGGCVDLATDSQNCGVCGNTCSGGKTCQNSICSCPNAESSCGSACVDTQRNPENCGGCGIACKDGRSCAQGQCVCPANSTQCGDGCVNVENDPLNCGGCGKACGLGQGCQARSCVGGAALGVDGCLGLAKDLTISQIAVYQAVKIPIMQSGKEVLPASRNTDVVTARDALFRVFVTVAPNWKPRALSARIFVQNGATVEIFHAQATLSSNSREAELATSFQVLVPKGKLKPETRYAVEVVECGAAISGATQVPRYPASAGVLLGARDTGPLKLRIVPMQTNGLSPDTSEKALQVYKDLLLALYPITEVQMSVGSALSVSDSSDWVGNLDQLRRRRQMDAPAADVYYYGLLKPASSYQAFCARGCIAGNGYVPSSSGNDLAPLRVSMGLGYADTPSAVAMAHEVAHNHGRFHAPCGRNLAGLDQTFPYTGGLVGVYGYDPRTQSLTAPERTDLMGYCAEKWISDYTYDGLVNRIATVNSAMAVYVSPELVQLWDMLLLDLNGPRWGAPFVSPGAPAGEPEPAEILDRYGRVIAIETAFRTPISDVDAFSFEVPARRVGWHSIRILGAPPLAY